ncbi:arsenate reductase family protein [Alkalibacterium sp. 20]|uniref:arsenate reductase family protein n=1 Tax=Alkalibacterium sp. 20 TaxID=1798803 RepID=UPI0008FFFBCA|nr:arsenate reductase family protein [Alkalibacterium sp. 20]OJF92153.1 hypothetical protein AX762_02825 [Alkalibacterium sp. 20]
MIKAHDVSQGGIHLEFYCHPRCSTCKKAQKWLDGHNISYTFKNLLETSPSKETWIQILSKSDRTIKSFFNTSGNVYRENNLKEKVPNMSIEEAAEWLSSNGMVVKRPLAMDGDKLTVGYKEDIYNQTWL